MIEATRTRFERPNEGSACTENGSQRVLERNIRVLLDLRERHMSERNIRQRAADAITRFAGSMTCVYLHLTVFGLWLLLNSGFVSGIEPFDPFPFVMLAMIASVEAIFLSTFVLISQNRQAELAQKRADLDLHINLLAEHEITHLLSLVDEIAKHVGAPRTTGTEPLKHDVAPEAVLRELERAEADSGATAKPSGTGRSPKLGKVHASKSPA